jgi:hypothetical protein
MGSQGSNQNLQFYFSFFGNLPNPKIMFENNPNLPCVLAEKKGY